MADFRKWFYALAMVALIVGITVPANAQGGVVTCNASTTPTLVRAEAYADFVGDYSLQCQGGTPTVPGAIVPSVNVTVFLSTNITSKLTAGSSGIFDEALLIFDEPNTPTNPTRPILNCGNGPGAPDNGVSGPGVCQIIAPSQQEPPSATPGLANPALTYDGTPGVQGGSGDGDAICDGTNPSGFSGNAITPAGRDPLAGSFGCGRPNVFQGRLGTSQASGINSTIVFAGVPFDPPGTLTTRQLRITNVRADAEILGVASSFVQQNITMSVSFTGTTFVTVTNFTQQQTVATVLHGLSILSDGKGDTLRNNLGFLQCDSENPKLFNPGATVSTGSDVPGAAGYSTQPSVTFVEGFQNSWKTKNISFMQTATAVGGTTGNGTLLANVAEYAGTINYPADLAQNIPGANYNTESGFEWVGTASSQTVGGGQQVPSNASLKAVITSGVNNNGFTLWSSNGTGIQNAGVATQGTRLALSFTNQPNGLEIFVPPVVLLTNGTNITGVMVLTSTAADGSGGFSPPSGIASCASPFTASTCPAAQGSGRTPSIGTNPLQQVSNNLVVYEILFTDPNSNETATVPVVVSFPSALSSNPPIGLPVPGQVEQVTGGFAPFYTTPSARQPSATLPVPRFIPGQTPLNIIEVVKCACDLLFPYVVSHDGFDTGIAIANTSLDPGGNFGFGATPQQGIITFFYFGTGAGGQVAPPSQSSGVVPAGQVLTYVLSSGAGNIGTTGPNGLDGRAGTGQFQGYIIAQSGFQYCHGFAFISPLGGGPLSPGISEGYLALVLDPGGLVRTAQVSENLVH
jgi:hypothetical protein